MSIYNRKNSPGEVWMRLTDDKIVSISEGLSAMTESFSDNSSVYSLLTSNSILDFKTFWTTHVITLSSGTIIHSFDLKDSVIISDTIRPTIFVELSANEIRANTPIHFPNENRILLYSILSSYNSTYETDVVYPLIRQYDSVGKFSQLFPTTGNWSELSAFSVDSSLGLTAFEAPIVLWNNENQTHNISFLGKSGTKLSIFHYILSDE